MIFQQPLTALNDAHASSAGHDDDTAVTLESQAKDIIRTVLEGTDRSAAPARHRLRSLLAVHPGDHITVLRQHLIQTRAPLSTPPGQPTAEPCPEVRPPFIVKTGGQQP